MLGKVATSTGGWLPLAWLVCCHNRGSANMQPCSSCVLPSVAGLVKIKTDRAASIFVNSIVSDFDLRDSGVDRSFGMLYFLTISSKVVLSKWRVVVQPLKTTADSLVAGWSSCKLARSTLDPSKLITSLNFWMFCRGEAAKADKTFLVCLFVMLKLIWLWAYHAQPVFT